MGENVFEVNLSYQNYNSISMYSRSDTYSCTQEHSVYLGKNIYKREFLKVSVANANHIYTGGLLLEYYKDVGYDYCLLHQVLQMRNVFETTAVT